MSYWFIRLSPDGLHVAGGHERLQEDGVDLGSGLAPRYAGNDTIFYGRHSDGAFMRWDRGRTSVVVRQQGFNFYEVAPDGRWMGYRPDPPRLIWWDEHPWLGWSTGAISNTRWAAIQYENSALWAGRGNGIDGTLVDPRPCSDVRLLGDILVWRTSGDIYAQREHGGPVENWSIEGEDHFWPVPVWVGTKLYVLTHTQDRLLLYEVKQGQTRGVVVSRGISDFPDIAALDDIRVRVVWTDKGVKHERVINLLEEPEVELRTIAETPVLDTTGNPIDPLVYAFGELANRDGDHYMCIHVDTAKRRWYEIKFAGPDNWEGFYWGDDFIGLWEDRSQSEPRYDPPWDYAFTEDIIMTRPMKPGVMIQHKNNEWIRFNPRTNKIIDRGPSPYHTWIGRVYKSYPFGGDVGTRPAFELNSRAEGMPTLERHIFALNVGRCIWQVVRVDSDVVQFQTKFVTSGGPRLTPTIGGRDANIAIWPPKKTVVGMTITDFQEVVEVRRGSRAVANPNPNEEWSQTISWWYAPDGTENWVQQDEPRNPRLDNDHTFRFPAPGRYKIRLKWESGQTEKKRVVTVR